MLRFIFPLHHFKLPSVEPSFADVQCSTFTTEL
jgi:hypothetical protein